jgi:hypothetical protein
MGLLVCCGSTFVVLSVSRDSNIGCPAFCHKMTPANMSTQDNNTPLDNSGRRAGPLACWETCFVMFAFSRYLKAGILEEGPAVARQLAYP